MQGNDINRLVNNLARVVSEQEGLGMDLNGARAMLANLGSKTV